MLELHLLHGTPTVVMQEAKVPGPLQALGQHMLQHQPQEVGPRQGSGRGSAGLGIAPAVGHLAVLAAQDIALRDDTPVQIAVSALLTPPLACELQL